MGKITVTRVYDLEESIVASGFPFRAEYNEDDFEYEVKCVTAYLESLKPRNFPIDNDMVEIGQKHWKRILGLRNNPSNSGHLSALKGILVSANFTFDQSFWMQFQRYHHVEINSSQSKQFRLVKMNLNNLENVSLKVIMELNRMISLYNSTENNQMVYDEQEYTKKDYFERIIKSCPVGLELTARVSMNYLQIINMTGQREKHPMSDWHTVFINWVKTLPQNKELIFNV